MAGVDKPLTHACLRGPLESVIWIHNLGNINDFKYCLKESYWYCFIRNFFNKNSFPTMPSFERIYQKNRDAFGRYER